MRFRLWTCGPKQHPESPRPVVRHRSCTLFGSGTALVFGRHTGNPLPVREVATLPVLVNHFRPVRQLRIARATSTDALSKQAEGRCP